MRSSFINFNPHQYEQHLSPFGRKVLQVLVKRWTSERKQLEQGDSTFPNACLQIRRNAVRNKVLTFRDESIADSCVPPQSPLLVPAAFHIDVNNSDDQYDNPPFDFPFTEGRSGLPPFACPPTILPTPALPITTIGCELSAFRHRPTTPVNTSFGTLIPTSIELVKTVETSRNNQNIINALDGPLQTADLYTNSAENDDRWNILHDLYDKDSDGADPCTNGNGLVNVNDNVNWEDMFDTELVPAHDASCSKKLETIQEVIANENAFQLNIPKETKTKPKQKSKMKKQKMITEQVENNTDIEKNPKIAKRKNKSRITDALPKKIKKVAEATATSKTLKAVAKNSFRKQNYSKTVKSWLDDVDPNHPVESESASINNDLLKSLNEGKDQHKVCIEKNDEQQKNNKKLIQAQLTNKGGVMKFGMPKTIQTNTEAKIEEALLHDYKQPVEKTAAKQKKSKPKFVAPIKSQLPVKDITYNIICVDSANSANTVELEMLNRFEKKEVMMILLYSNGFCQLNEQHTEDTCVPEGVMLYIEEIFYYVKGNGESFRETLQRVLNRNTTISYEGKHVLIYLTQQLGADIDCEFDIIDAKIAGSILESESPPSTFTELQKLTGLVTEYTVATQCPLQKAAWYMTLLEDCVGKLKEMLVRDQLWTVFADIEMKILPIIAGMEHRGVSVDVELLESMERTLQEKLKEAEAACHEAAGRPFQVTSSSQVRSILYAELQLDARANLRVRGTLTRGDKSTSEDMLRALSPCHPLPGLVLHYRRLHKAHATFLAGVLTHVKGGVVKPIWEQTAAATGRVACSAPNLQAVPRAPFSLARPGDTAEAEVVSFRSVFRARAGRLLLAADFRQAECRVVAHAAGDHVLRGALDDGGDLFLVLAAKWLNKPLGEVSSAERDRTKRVVYGALYGAGARALAAALHVTYGHALQVLAGFNRTFPSLKRFVQDVIERCAASGGEVRTLCGRRRVLTGSGGSGGAGGGGHADRQAVNFVVQGTAADLCKLALAATARALRAAACNARLLLQLHDELVWEVPVGEFKAVAEVVVSAMEGCGLPLGLPPLPAALRRGETWGSLETYDVTGETAALRGGDLGDAGDI